MTEALVLYEIEQHIATITMNRPERMNAYNREMRDGLAQAFLKAEADPEVRAIILTGAGRAFCAGLDLKQLRSPDDPHRPDRQPLHLPYIIAMMDKPLIAAINGYAVGVGFEFALLCDFRIMAEDAVLNDMHAKRGLVPDGGATWLLTRQVGWSRACKVLLLAEPIDAPTAEGLGLVDQVVATGAVVPAARDLAARLAANAPLSVRYTKRVMREGLTQDFHANIRTVGRLAAEVWSTADRQEGGDAFREKRPPKFVGR